MIAFAPHALKRTSLPASVVIAAGLLILQVDSAAACSQVQNNGNGCGTSNHYCSNGVLRSGGWQIHGSSPYPQYATAAVNTYNPTPVWSTSSIYVALENTQYSPRPRGCCIAQVGYIHWDNFDTSCATGFVNPGTGATYCSDGNIHVFTEWSYDGAARAPYTYTTCPLIIQSPSPCSGCSAVRPRQGSTLVGPREARPASSTRRPGVRTLTRRSRRCTTGMVAGCRRQAGA